MARSLNVQLTSERQLQTKLNISRWPGCRDCSERRATEVVFQVAEIGTIERVEEISLELQFEFLSETYPSA